MGRQLHHSRLSSLTGQTAATLRGAEFIKQLAKIRISWLGNVVIVVFKRSRRLRPSLPIGRRCHADSHRRPAPVERMSRPNSTVEMEQSLFFFWGIRLSDLAGKKFWNPASGAVPKFQGLAVRCALPKNTWSPGYFRGDFVESYHHACTHLPTKVPGILHHLGLRSVASSVRTVTFVLCHCQAPGPRGASLPLVIALGAFQSSILLVAG